MCNHFEAFSVCCYVIITELAHYNETKKERLTWVPCGGPFFLFRQLDRNGSISLKCMACNHFVALFVRCCAIITELARYNENKIDTGTLWRTTCLQSSCGIIKWVPKDFFADINSMKSRRLDGMLRFLKHAPALEIFWPKLWIFQQFSLLGERGGLGWDDLCHRNLS